MQVLFGVPATPADANIMRFSPDGKRLAVGFETGEIDVRQHVVAAGQTYRGLGASQYPEYWERSYVIQGLKDPERIHPLADLSWAPTADRLAIATGVERDVLLYSVPAGERPSLLKTLKHTGPVLGVAWDPQDTFMAVQQYHQVCIWDMRDKERKQYIKAIVTEAEGKAKEVPHLR